jgi:hypothetical protein
MAYSDVELVNVFDWVSWLDPQVMMTAEGSWLTCRLCVAHNGIRAEDLPDVGFTCREDFDSHMRSEHPDVVR